MTDTAASPSRAQEFVPSLNDEILADMIADGTDLVEACDVLGLGPSGRRQIHRRINRDPEFAEFMEAARVAGYEAIASRTRKVSRGVEGHSTGDWKRDQLVCKQDNWLLEKWHPKAYGQKLEVESVNKTANVAISDDPNEAARQYADLVGGKG
jgi:hypothetical protein